MIEPIYPAFSGTLSTTQLRKLRAQRGPTIKSICTHMHNCHGELNAGMLAEISVFVGLEPLALAYVLDSYGTRVGKATKRADLAGWLTLSRPDVLRAVRSRIKRLQKGLVSPKYFEQSN